LKIVNFPLCKSLNQEARQLGSAALQYFRVWVLDRKSPVLD
jgi:hypothetical protein